MPRADSATLQHTRGKRIRLARMRVLRLAAPLRCSPRSRQRSCCSPSPREPAVSQSSEVTPADQSLYPQVEACSPSFLSRISSMATSPEGRWCLPVDRLPGFRDLLGGVRAGSAASVPSRIRRGPAVGHSLGESIALSHAPGPTRAQREHSIDTTFLAVRGRLHLIAILSARSEWTPHR